MRPFALVLLALATSATLPSTASAQVVRGTVTERTSGAPVAGAVVELLRADPDRGRSVASVLTDPAGGYALRAPAAGRYVVSAKRVGVRRFQSPALSLEAGATRALDIVLDAVLYELPEVVVAASSACAAERGDAARVAAMWEEARTALLATQLSLRDRLFTAQVSRYVRELDPRSKRTLNEYVSEARGVVASPFQSLSAESLSTAGYWRAQPSGAVIYYGPDVDVLLSDAFLRDHCFRVVRGEHERAGIAGLTFAPASRRAVPDVVGTLWLDARTFELQLVQFAYDRVAAGVDSSAVGGEVHFARLPSGAWIVRRWFLRMPVRGRPAQPLSTEGDAPWVLVRPSELRLQEEGGLVTTDELRPPSRPGSVRGVLVDSVDRPVPGAEVRIGGSSSVARSDDAGRFAFDRVAAGPLTVVARTAGYDSLGVPAADLALAVRQGEESRVTLKARDARALTLALCDQRPAPFGRGTLYLAVRDSASGAPAPGAPVRLSWRSSPTPDDSVGRVRDMERTTDERGIAVFCEVPGDWPLTVTPSPAGRGESLATPLTIAPRAVRRVDLRVAR